MKANSNCFFLVLTERSYYEEALEIIRSKPNFSQEERPDLDDDENRAQKLPVEFSESVLNKYPPRDMNFNEDANFSGMSYANDSGKSDSHRLPPLSTKSMEENDVIREENPSRMSSASSVKSSASILPKIDSRYLPK